MSSSLKIASQCYYYLGDRLVAKKSGGELRYIHQDHLTGTALVTTEAGEAAGTMKYYPFGESRNSQGNTATDRLFTGQRLDDIGLYYYGARYYDPQIGRFISADTIVPDPMNPQSLNRYSYCLNNPLRYVDPTGHFSWPDLPSWDEIVEAYQGLWEAAVDTVNGIVQTITDPIGTVESVVYAVTHLSETIDSIASYYDPSTPTGIGHIAFEVLSLGISAGFALESKAATITGRLSAGAGRAGTKGIGWTGRIGANALKQLGGVSNKFFPTSRGARFVDQFVNNVAHESKVGCTNLTKSVANQVAKDAELVASGKVDAAIWHFYKSPVTGKVGPSKQLADALRASGIDYIIDPP